jgi:SHAQKYF class myb-like DNA-binding protein
MDDRVANNAAVPVPDNITNLFLQHAYGETIGLTAAVNTAEQPVPPQQQQQQQQQKEMEADQDDDDNDNETGGVKKSRLVWTQELHNRFINALSQLGLRNAVPKSILSLMNVEGMSRENVASHLQKYRIYLKRIGGYAQREKLESDVLQRLHEQNVQQMATQQALQQKMTTAGYPGYDAFAAAFMGAYNYDGSLALPSMPSGSMAAALNSDHHQQQQQQQQQNEDDGDKQEQQDLPDANGTVVHTGVTAGPAGNDVSQPPAVGEEGGVKEETAAPAVAEGEEKGEAPLDNNHQQQVPTTNADIIVQGQPIPEWSNNAMGEGPEMMMMMMAAAGWTYPQNFSSSLFPCPLSSSLLKEKNGGDGGRGEGGLGHVVVDNAEINVDEGEDIVDGIPAVVVNSDDSGGGDSDSDSGDVQVNEWNK